ncbi:hypothetical protein OESDEN_06811 [Oesophagostomum dentatum]|uniref:Uncharacterized protein n=1 Tax=Oesophagostomum dentatum TaxID=61180 RepID=A0A0B1T6U8_OESDE|nr:hypothetical protein OESDEN_06811 [Oesophagostomum dentatum]
MVKLVPGNPKNPEYGKRKPDDGCASTCIVVDRQVDQQHHRWSTKQMVKLVPGNPKNPEYGKRKPDDGCASTCIVVDHQVDQQHHRWSTKHFPVFPTLSSSSYK